jgi:nicotinate-nucleotide adenylyltransferase
VWWLVSPQNPLKPEAGMAPFDKRLTQAAAFVGDPRIRVLDLERQLGTRYTIDTVTALQRLYPRTRFVLLIGADNLAEMRRWRKWQALFARLPVAVFARPSYCRHALAELPAERFAKARIPLPARRLAWHDPPAWAFFPVRLDPSSATEIRSSDGAKPRR